MSARYTECKCKKNRTNLSLVFGFQNRQDIQQSHLCRLTHIGPLVVLESVVAQTTYQRNFEQSGRYPKLLTIGTAWTIWGGGVEVRSEIHKFVNRVHVCDCHLVLGQCTLRVFVCERAAGQRSELSDIPVLSEQITLTLPNASTLGSFLTIALRLDILKTPSASVTVVTIGRPSGMAATARDTGGGNEF